MFSKHAHLSLTHELSKAAQRKPAGSSDELHEP